MNNKYDQKIRKVNLEGTEATVVIKPTNTSDIGNEEILKGSFTIANRPEKTKGKVLSRKRSFMTEDIGIGSKGFTKIFTLAGIISLIGIIIIIILFKY